MTAQSDCAASRRPQYSTVNVALALVLGRVTKMLSPFTSRCSTRLPEWRRLKRWAQGQSHLQIAFSVGEQNPPTLANWQFGLFRCHSKEMHTTLHTAHLICQKHSNVCFVCVSTPGSTPYPKSIGPSFWLYQCKDWRVRLGRAAVQIVQRFQEHSKQRLRRWFLRASCDDLQKAMKEACNGLLYSCEDAPKEAQNESLLHSGITHLRSNPLDLCRGG